MSEVVLSDRLFSQQPVITPRDLYETGVPFNDLPDNLDAEVKTTLADVGAYGDGVAAETARRAMAALEGFVTPPTYTGLDGEPFEGRPVSSVTLIDLPMKDWDRDGVRALAGRIYEMIGLTARNQEYHTLRKDYPHTGSPFDVEVCKGQLDPERPVFAVYRPVPGRPSHQQLILLDGRKPDTAHLLQAVNTLTRHELDQVSQMMVDMDATRDEINAVLAEGEITRFSTHGDVMMALYRYLSGYPAEAPASTTALALPAAAGSDTEQLPVVIDEDDTRRAVAAVAIKRDPIEAVAAIKLALAALPEGHPDRAKLLGELSFAQKAAEAVQGPTHPRAVNGTRSDGRRTLLSVLAEFPEHRERTLT